MLNSTHTYKLHYHDHNKGRLASSKARMLNSVSKSDDAQQRLRVRWFQCTRALKPGARPAVRVAVRVRVRIAVRVTVGSRFGSRSGHGRVTVRVTARVTVGWSWAARGQGSRARPQCQVTVRSWPGHGQVTVSARSVHGQCTVTDTALSGHGPVRARGPGPRRACTPPPSCWPG